LTMLSHKQVKVEKVPALTCPKCGSTHVMMTKDGPDCDDCGVIEDTFVELCRKVEYSIYQSNEEMEKNEAF
jgi:uncharacterized OB-fold protein